MSRLDWERDGQVWPHREASQFLRAGRTEWHVQIMGPEDAPGCLLLHGTGAASHSWRGLMPLLARRFRVIAPDLPGHGFSRAASMMQLSLSGMAQEVDALLTALNTRPGLGIGHSAGAPIMARMALDGLASPERIIAVNGAFLPFQGLAAQIFPGIAKALIWNPFLPHMVAWSAAMDPAAAGRLLRSTGSAIEAEGIELYHLLFQSRVHVQSTLNMMARWDLDRLAADLPRFSIPTTLLIAEQDQTIPPADQQKAADLIPGAEILTLPGLGHLAHEEAPEQVAELV
ncbi:MAG: alpha/beta fold hydrolase BchO [Pseudomonadota bacterium]